MATTGTSTSSGLGAGTGHEAAAAAGPKPNYGRLPENIFRDVILARFLTPAEIATLIVTNNTNESRSIGGDDGDQQDTKTASAFLSRLSHHFRLADHFCSAHGVRWTNIRLLAR